LRGGGEEIRGTVKERELEINGIMEVYVRLEYLEQRKKDRDEILINIS
jgi:hypothetical protein